MNVKYPLLKILVWNMRWMIRYLGFIARPFVRWYADQEVIACGLRSDKGDVRIIYSTTQDRLGHSFFKREKTGWRDIDGIPTDNFSGDLVYQVILPGAKIGDVDVVRTKRKNGNRTISSPKITIKEKTPVLPDLIEIDSLPNGMVSISWKKGEQFDHMIYFFALENDQGKTLAGIYTVENTWIYPLIKKVSLSVGEADPALLQKGKQYNVKLVIVDFDGWVSCMGRKSFTY